MNKLSKELVGASSIPLILTVIANQESYGYEIIQKIKELSDGKIEFGEGTLYPVLHKLEKKGYLESFWKKSASGRSRKYYKISSDGKKELANQQENWTTINQIISKLWNKPINLV